MSKSLKRVPKINKTIVVDKGGKNEKVITRLFLKPDPQKGDR